MALSENTTPYGLRDIKITPYTDAMGTVLADAPIDLPIARTLSFTDTEEFEQLRGDDRVAAEHGNGAQVEWELESGGLPFEAFKAMAGGTIEETGVSPTAKRVFSKKVTDQRPYFKIEGQVISDSGGDLHCIIYRAKATGELSGEFSDGSFFLTSASGVGHAVPSGEHVDKLYDFVQNETVTPIVSTSTPDETP
ncbi:major tail protein [Microbacterium phage JDawG]|nr:major tail protein [Microbacterium phage DannyDe]WNM68233.1 major tail protein [Microbacterium phage JDawG]